MRVLLVLTAGVIFAGIQPVPPGPRFRPRGEEPIGRFAQPDETNELDRTLFELARIQVLARKFEDGEGTLKRILESSPDTKAKNFARYDLALLYDQAGRFDEAITTYLLVEGELRAEAIDSAINCCTHAKLDKKLEEIMRGLVEEARSKREKIFLQRRLADAYQRMGNLEKAIEVLKQITESLTYEEAEKLRKWAEDYVNELTRDAFDALAKGQREEFERLFDEATMRVRERIERCFRAGRMDEARDLERAIRKAHERFRALQITPPPQPQPERQQ